MRSPIQKFKTVVVICIVLVAPSICSAEQPANPSFLSLSAGTIRTDAEDGALGVNIAYSEIDRGRYTPAVIKAEGIQLGSGWLIGPAPEILIQTGSKDAFNSVIAKVGADFVPLIDDASATDPNNQDFASPPAVVLPVALGFESDRSFDFVNALAEIGIVPLSKEMGQFKLGKNPKLGLYFQAGYKFGIDKDAYDLDKLAPGGAGDESKEDPGNLVCRVKLDGSIRLDLLAFSGGKRMLSLIPGGAVWYDLANGQFYPRLDTILRLTLAPRTHFDLRYENGSDAPNFNQGEQFGAYLTLEYQ